MSAAKVYQHKNMQQMVEKWSLCKPAYAGDRCIEHNEQNFLYLCNSKYDPSSHILECQTDMYKKALFD